MTKVELAEKKEEEIVKSTLEHMEGIREHYKSLTPPCPIEGQPGKFVEMLVTPPPVTAAKYHCPEGDVFSWREGIGAKLLSNQRVMEQR